MAYLLGIDGGGTGCRAAVVDPDGRIVASGESGPANIVSDFAVAVANILGAARSALGQVGINPSSDALKVGLGLAGGNAEGAVRDLGFTLPFRRMRIASDAETAAKGALGQADGILAAIGTGSVFVIQHAGRIRQIGGWGFTLGDEGSGASMGRQLLALTLKMADGRQAESGLLRALLDEMGGSGEIPRFAATASPADFARMAPRVLETDDPAAAAIRDDAVREVAGVIAFLQPNPPLPVIITGGLAAFYERRLAGRWDLRPQLGTALDGALLLAREVA